MCSVSGSMQDTLPAQFAIGDTFQCGNHGNCNTGFGRSGEMGDVSQYVQGRKWAGNGIKVNVFAMHVQCACVRSAAVTIGGHREACVA